MSRFLARVLGLAMIGIGALWTLQGLDYLGGSSMSGDEHWAIAGPLMAALGVAILIVVRKPRR
jgi:hypothetical protein